MTAKQRADDARVDPENRPAASAGGVAPIWVLNVVMTVVVAVIYVVAVAPLHQAGRTTLSNPMTGGACTMPCETSRKVDSRVKLSSVCVVRTVNCGGVSGRLPRASMPLAGPFV